MAKQETVAVQSSKNFINLVIGFGIGTVSTLIVLPSLFRNEPDILGAIQVVIAYIYLLSELLTVGAPLAIVKFFKQEIELLKSPRRLVILSTLLAFVGFSLVSGVYYYYPNIFHKLMRNNDGLASSSFMDAVIYGALLVGINRILGGFLNALGLTNKVTFANEVLLRLLLLLWSTFYAFSTKGDLASFSVLSIFMIIGCYFIVELINRKKKSNWLNSDVKKEKPIKLVEMLRFSSYNGLLNIINTLQLRLDVLVMAYFVSTADIVVYNIGVFLATAVLMPLRAINPMATTVISQAWVDKDFRRIQRVYKAAAINQLVLSGLMLIAIIGGIPIIKLILPESFQGFESSLVILGCAKLVHAAFGNNNSVLGTSPLYRLGVVVHTFFVLLFGGLLYWLIPIYEKEGAAIALLISLLVFNLLKAVILKVKFKLEMFTNHYLFGSLLLSIGIVLTTWVSFKFNSILFSGLVSLLIIASISYVGFIQIWSEDLNKMIFSLKDQILSRLK
jgi:O-antigen/teichoic acid export membrane protein